MVLYKEKNYVHNKDGTTGVETSLLILLLGVTNTY